MGASELLVLSLGLSIAVAALCRAVGGLVERSSADPRLRDRVWATALMLPALPPAAVGLLLLTPPPVREAAPIQAVITQGGAARLTATTAETAAQAFVLDPALAAWAGVAAAGLLTFVRLAALALRARRLDRMIRQADPADASLVEMVDAAARALAVPPPRVSVSGATHEALLAGLGRTRLILPTGLTEAADAAVVQAVIAHELAHLKRGDHRALWLEEALLTLLAANPLMPLLRARRAAAREEACDALALAGAAPETRRAYAQSLIEALRSRAGPQAAGVLPALTFTGAGRTTAMHRLKAVLTPAAPAGRRTRAAVAAAGAALLAAVAAGSVAVAAQREPEVRLADAQGADGFGPRFDMPKEFRVNGQRIDLDFASLPPFGFQAERIEMAAAPSGGAPAWVDYRVSLSPNALPLSLEGARLPEGVTTDIVMPEFVDRIERRNGGLNIVLKREAAAQDAPPRPRPLSPDRQARYRGLSAQGYREVCASRDPSDDGFCSGVMFAQMGKDGVCPPAEATATDGDTGAALAAYVDRGRQVITSLPPRTDEGAYGYAERAMALAFPCPARAVRADGLAVRMPVSVDIGGAGLVLAADEQLRVVLVDERRVELGESVTASLNRSPLSQVEVPLTEKEFPPLGAANRAYTLIGEVRGSDGTVRYTAEPATIRLAPGSRRTAANLAASLSFRRN